MRASPRVFAVAMLCLSSLAAGQSLPDEVIANQLLGPQWKQLARRAGIIFAGTVLATAPQTVTPTQLMERAIPGAIPAIQWRFRVDEAIAGVESGQILTVHEWAGASSMHRALRPGEHILIFLYAPSRLGLTSPVGGPLGVIALDSSGKNLSTLPGGARFDPANISVGQVERAIRSAREE
jgi:hypothetical protein